MQAAFPYSLTIQHSPIRIGVIHGHQSIPVGDLDALGSVARQMDVDVLVSGSLHLVGGTIEVAGLSEVAL